MNPLTRAVGLAAMRERRGLTPLQLAQRLGLGEDQIGALESGKIGAGIRLRMIPKRYFDMDYIAFDVVSIEAPRRT